MDRAHHVLFCTDDPKYLGGGEMTCGRQSVGGDPAVKTRDDTAL